jgi:hypothetical protein
MRLALVILIALAQTAGTWLCCCGPARVSMAFGGTTDRRTDVTPVKAPSGCPHCHKDAESPADPAPMPAHRPEPCPCGGVEFVAIPADRLSEVESIGTPVSVEPAALAPLSSPVISLAVASVPGLRELPILTARDRLYAHHVLRC